jgi:hypothetical protein
MSKKKKYGITSWATCVVLSLTIRGAVPPFSHILVIEWYLVEHGEKFKIAWYIARSGE